MDSDTVSFCQNLAHQCVGLESLLAEHIADNHEILPHLFMGDVTRFVLSGVEERRQIVSYLEQGLQNESEDVKDLIAVSFVENLETELKIEQALEGLEADALWKEWKQQQSD